MANGIFNMSRVFLLYEGGCGNEVEENSGSKVMNYIVDQNEFIVETNYHSFRILAEKSTEET
ncbi:hypothetical protein BX666DRAFT_1890350 [Dichotomocladium elegans]|nr:hypothetical protein BX666DRAFT_1890350 [Dichotomocladium elegans]